MSTGALEVVSERTTLCFASALNANRVGEVGSWVTGRYKDDYRFSSKSEIFDDQGIIYTPNTVYLRRDI